jgi:hypothetical protein
VTNFDTICGQLPVALPARSHCAIHSSGTYGRAYPLLLAQGMARVWTLVATFACLGALLALVAGAAVAIRAEPLITEIRIVLPP